MISLNENPAVLAAEAQRARRRALVAHIAVGVVIVAALVAGYVFLIRPIITQ